MIEFQALRLQVLFSGFRFKLQMSSFKFQRSDFRFQAWGTEGLATGEPTNPGSHVRLIKKPCKNPSRLKPS